MVRRLKYTVDIFGPAPEFIMRCKGVAETAASDPGWPVTQMTRRFADSDGTFGGVVFRFPNQAFPITKQLSVVSVLFDICWIVSVASLI